MRLALLADWFYCFGERGHASLAGVYRNLPAAGSWRELFTAVRP